MTLLPITVVIPSAKIALNLTAPAAAAFTTTQPAGPIDPTASTTSLSIRSRYGRCVLQQLQLAEYASLSDKPKECLPFHAAAQVGSSLAGIGHYNWENYCYRLSRSPIAWFQLISWFRRGFGKRDELDRIWQALRNAKRAKQISLSRVHS